MVSWVGRGELVSVIVTAYNAGRFLDGCLTSIVSSTHRQLDVVVVDDGSTDSTAEIIEGWSRRDPRIHAVTVAHVGRRRALELAHERARGEVFCWVDADDEVLPRGIEFCLRRLDRDHQLVYTYRELIDDKGRSLGPHVKNRVSYRPMQLLVDNMIFHLRMYTGELFDRSGGVGDLDSSIDWDMNLRMAELTTPACIPRVLYRYRVHGDRMSSSAAQAECGVRAVQRAIERRNLDARLVVNESGWHLVQRSQ
jgi:glycosyltransferase involved in cell wall biosynthesis